MCECVYTHAHAHLSVGVGVIIISGDVKDDMSNDFHPLQSAMKL